MGKDTLIEWASNTMNPWRGCTKISPGCTNCYADTLSKRNPAVLGVWGPSGTRVVASESKWREPLAWDRAAAKANERPRVFCASLADVFEDWQGPMVSSKGNPFWWCYGSLSNSPLPSTGLPEGCRLATMNDIRDRLFQTIEDTRGLDWLLLTKRPERWRRCWPLDPVPGHVRQNEGDGKDWRKIPNLWMGTTVENRAAKSRIDVLREIPAHIRFLSMEPLIEDPGELDLRGIHWVIVGGESGHHARPFYMAWARSIRDQCQAAGVAFFMKQVGSCPVVDSFALADGWGDGTRAIDDPKVPGYLRLKLKDGHGGDWDEWPEDLRAREFPHPVEMEAKP